IRRMLTTTANALSCLLVGFISLLVSDTCASAETPAITGWVNSKFSLKRPAESFDETNSRPDHGRRGDQARANFNVTMNLSLSSPAGSTKPTPRQARCSVSLNLHSISEPPPLRALVVTVTGEPACGVFESCLRVNSMISATEAG